jgi:hypothetical protein
MIGGAALLLGSLAAALQASAAAVPEFPCDALSGAMLEVYEGFGEAAGAAAAPVAARGGAVLLDRSVPLVARAFVIAGAAAAGEAGQPMQFRKYRLGSATFYCTTTRSDALFGAGDREAQFMLRCLSDADGDGRYEGFARHGRLVPLAGRRMLPGGEGESEGPPELLPLRQAVTLAPAAGPVHDALGTPPRVRMRITMQSVRGDRAEIRFFTDVELGPSMPRPFMGRSDTVVAIRMTDGNEVPMLGTRIGFARQGRQWTAAARGGFGREPRLLCSGTVVEAGDAFAVFTPGGHVTFARSALPGAR